MNFQANQQLNTNNPSSHPPDNRLGNCRQTSLPTCQLPQISSFPVIQTGSPHPNHRAHPKTDPTNPVTTAANACHQGVTDANNIAVTPAEVPPTANASVTLANSKCNVTDPCHTNASGKCAMPFGIVYNIFYFFFGIAQIL